MGSDNPDRPQRGETPNAWALRMAAAYLDEFLYYWVPGTASTAHVLAARRLLRRLRREAKEASRV